MNGTINSYLTSSLVLQSWLVKLMFFCITLYCEESDRGQKITAKKPDKIDEFT